MVQKRVQCQVCATLAPGELIELDLILGDPLRWPATVWGNFPPPSGGLPVSYRRHGAQRMGHEWLLANGFDIPKQHLRNHIRWDVPLQEVSVDELVQRGLISLSQGGPKSDDSEPIDPLAYIKLYNKGIAVGFKGLELLQQRIQALVDQKEDVPLALMKLAIDAGLKLAQSQAGIKASGKTFGDEDADEDDAFRGGSDISPEFQHNRVRTIEGESRPVADEGFADRQRFNERARQEGSPTIGGR